MARTQSPSSPDLFRNAPRGISKISKCRTDEKLLQGKVNEEKRQFSRELMNNKGQGKVLVERESPLVRLKAP